ncbi:TKL protein kinase [Salpingoeca rosetta]|uniref:TKL protein kinase n=1 Tax=Salpingoeca rosetta (strain ATCC 50818 / BSB-021) TaxID=946362 RepID=F2U341_SALR5|nr:TKL protein kinase [Salpingoeca rosetta]EGD82035.1 TKL protein kinase [Salpingoeca rosetta]|eukprot:XP_004996218.1 TKL protein kinase [Salpingoeca rosetta]
MKPDNKTVENADDVTSDSRKHMDKVLGKSRYFAEAQKSLAVLAFVEHLPQFHRYMDLKPKEKEAWAKKLFDHVTKPAYLNSLTTITVLDHGKLNKISMLLLSLAPDKDYAKTLAVNVLSRVLTTLSDNLDDIDIDLLQRLNQNVLEQIADFLVNGKVGSEPGSIPQELLEKFKEDLERVGSGQVSEQIKWLTAESASASKLFSKVKGPLWTRIEAVESEFGSVVGKLTYWVAKTACIGLAVYSVASLASQWKQMNADDRAIAILHTGVSSFRLMMLFDDQITQALSKGANFFSRKLAQQSVDASFASGAALEEKAGQLDKAARYLNPELAVDVPETSNAGMEMVSRSLAEEAVGIEAEAEKTSALTARWSEMTTLKKFVRVGGLVLGAATVVYLAVDLAGSWGNMSKSERALNLLNVSAFGLWLVVDGVAFAAELGVSAVEALASSIVPVAAPVLLAVGLVATVILAFKHKKHARVDTPPEVFIKSKVVPLLNSISTPSRKWLEGTARANSWARETSPYRLCATASIVQFQLGDGHVAVALLSQRQHQASAARRKVAVHDDNDEGKGSEVWPCTECRKEQQQELMRCAVWERCLLSSLIHNQPKPTYCCCCCLPSSSLGAVLAVATTVVLVVVGRLLPLTHTSTFSHSHLFTSPRPFHNTKDRTLSPSVDTTLKHLETTLNEHRVPFATGHLGADINAVLFLTVSGHEAVNSTTDTSTLQAASMTVMHLSLQGHVESEVLQSIVGNGMWTSCTTVRITGVQFPVFHLSVLNDFPILDAITIEHSTLLQADTGGFEHAAQLFALRLGNNSLASVPKLARMTSLVELDLDRNKIPRIQADAFEDLTALRELFLDSNIIRAIPTGAFHSLKHLTWLELGANPIQHLHAHVFAGLTQLHTLKVGGTLLTSLPPTIFQTNRRLNDVVLEGNLLTSLPGSIFAGLTSLRHLSLRNNRLTSLQPALFRDLVSLSTLRLNDNKLTALPDRLLDSCYRLKWLYCDNNRLSGLSPDLFAHTPNLRVVTFENNRLRHVDGLFDTEFPRLERIDMAANKLTRFHIPTHWPSLHTLVLGDNPMQYMPDMTKAPALRVLRMQNHGVKRIDLTPLLTLPSLTTVELDAAHDDDRTSRAVLDATNLTPSPHLRTLSLQHVDVSEVLGHLLQLPLQLQVLGLGWPGADNRTLPLEMIQRNEHLKLVIVPSALRELNASDCTQLTQIDAPFIDVLDISNTRIQPSTALCTRWGRRVFFARNLRAESNFNSASAPATISTCLFLLDVVDLSGNKWLNDPVEVNRIVGHEIALSKSNLRRNGRVFPRRPRAPVLQLQDAPIDCALQLSSGDFDLFDNTIPGLVGSVTEIVYSFHCQCSQGHEMRRGRCEPIELDIVPAVLGTLAGVLALQALLFIGYRTYKRQRRLQADNALKDQLLVEMDEEVMALKKAWEIGYDELKMIKRVAAGAFGVVFKAEWDTVLVAVKVLQQGVMAFDESTVLEFERRWNPNGSPFLVLEFVAMGSLKNLLGKDMEQVLMEVEQGERGGEESVGQGVTASEIVGEELTLVSTGIDRRAKTTTVWELKLRLLRDVASGMAFIHSLDQMHRDLKSGNVLVSSSLRAKITDFGSIRQCFTRGADDDPQYSQQAGMQTMTSMTLTAGVGTPLYMAPEALTGSKYSFEADIFSFGVLMWEVATQRVPDLIEQEKGSGYRGPILATISNLMADGKRLKFEDSEQDAIPEWFQSLTYKCMAQNPRERPSFGELKDHHLA